MSLSNLSRAYTQMHERALVDAMRARLSEDQLSDFSELLAQWFVDSDDSAREWLREIALAHREERAKSVQQASTV